MQRELDAAAKAKNREEYDRAIARAEQVMQVERALQKTFKDTAVGQFWDEYGSVMPAAVGTGVGMLNRGMHPTAPLWAPVLSGDPESAARRRHLHHATAAQS